MLIFKRPWTDIRHVPGGAHISEHWRERGLKSLYILDKARWKINQVTGLIGGADALVAGPMFPTGWLRTPGTARHGATLEHGLALDITPPFSIVAGWRRISGSVSWSLLDNASTTWDGAYAEASGQFKNVISNGFTGESNAGGIISSAAMYETNNLRAFSEYKAALDTSTTIPTNISASAVSLGWSQRSAAAYDNPSVAEFTHWGIFQGTLRDDELSLLARMPGQLFVPRRIFVPMPAGAASTYTLSAATYAPGSLTATGVTPRVTVAVA